MTDHAAHQQEIESAIRVASAMAIEDFIKSNAMDLVIDRAVKNTFLQLGIDVSNPETMRRDMAYLRSWSEAMSVVKSTGIASLVRALIHGTLALIIVGATYYFATGKSH